MFEKLLEKKKRKDGPVTSYEWLTDLFIYIIYYVNDT